MLITVLKELDVASPLGALELTVEGVKNQGVLGEGNFEYFFNEFIKKLPAVF